MTVIESKNIFLVNSPEEVFHFLSDLRNHQEIMPEQVANFTASEDKCSYLITGTGSLSLKKLDVENEGKITLVPDGKSPFNFDLNWVIVPENQGSKVQAVLNADLNFIMKSVAQTPLKNFIEMQVTGLERVMQSKKQSS